MKRFGLVLLVGCAHSAAPAVATTSPAVKTPATLAFYVGDWSCDATGYDETGKVTDTYPKLEVRVAKAYDGWLRVDVIDKGQQVTSELKGQDPKGVFHHVWTADDGTYGSLTAPAWVDNKLVFDDDHPGAEKLRMTFTKKDDTHYEHKAEVDSGKGFYTQLVKTCHKIG